jgi:Mechanosensitive ion channel, conserved TM helix
MESRFGTAFVNALTEYFRTLAAALPGVLALIVIVGLGVGIGWLLSRVCGWILRVAGFDKFSYRTGFTSLLEKGNVRKQPSELVGSIVYWVLILASLLAGLQALHVEAVEKLSEGFLGYIPNLLLAIVTLVLGYLLMIFLGRTVLIAAVNARLKLASWLSAVVQIVIMLFAIAMAADELGIAGGVVTLAFSIVFGGLVLAVSLAFGLGARDIARDWLERHVTKDPGNEGKGDGFSHI